MTSNEDLYCLLVAFFGGYPAVWGRDITKSESGDLEKIELKGLSPSPIGLC